MSNAIVSYQTSLMKYNPSTLDEIIKLSELFAASGLFPSEGSQRQSAAQLAVKILAGQELGFTPFAAANGMNIIQGKCVPNANLMAAKVKATGRYDYKVTEMTDNRVNIDFYENGKLIGSSPFTAADAVKAQTKNMGKFPRNMLFARAMSNGVKWYTPDIFNGVAVYTADELGATVDYETGEIVEVAQAQIEQKQPELVEVAEQPPVISQDGPIDGKPPRASDAQRNRLHALGTELYGKDWDDERHNIVDKITSGETASSNDLTPNECATLITRLEMEQLGRALYGDNWSQVGQHNAERISGGDVSDPHELHIDSIRKLVKGMKELQAKRTHTNGATDK